MVRHGHLEALNVLDVNAGVQLDLPKLVDREHLLGGGLEQALADPIAGQQLAAGSPGLVFCFMDQGVSILGKDKRHLLSPVGAPGVGVEGGAIGAEFFGYRIDGASWFGAEEDEGSLGECRLLGYGGWEEAWRSDVGCSGGEELGLRALFDGEVEGFGVGTGLGSGGVLATVDVGFGIRCFGSLGGFHLGLTVAPLVGAGLAVLPPLG